MAFTLCRPGRRMMRRTSVGTVNQRMALTSDNNTRPAKSKYDQLMAASRLSLAPMMEYTDRHFRHLIRLISSRTLLYTEMVAANALAHEARAAQQEYVQQHAPAQPPPHQQEVRANYRDTYLRRFLGQGRLAPLEGPSVLQLGGSDPEQMYEAARTVIDMAERGWCDYTAINLNCGCPSPKVAGKGCFGASLMENPRLVAELARALHDGCGGKLPITVKCRIGTDSKQPFTRRGYAEMNPEEEYADLCRFVETVASDGVVTDFAVHARIAVLQKSFSPADNRKIPPLKYDVVHRLVRDYPELTFSLNGGVDSLSQAKSELDACPGLLGVMVGRAWAADPWSFGMADHVMYDSSLSCPAKNRWEILEAFGEHADAEEEMWDPIRIRRFIVKAVIPLFAGEPNSKRYRVALDEIAGLPKRLASEGKSLSGHPPLSELILNAAREHISEEVLLRSPKESYERVLWEEEKRNSGDGRPQTLVDWQALRLQEKAAGCLSSQSNSTSVQSATAA